MPTFSETSRGYKNLWNSASLVRTDAALKVAQGMMRDRDRYKAAEDSTGVPWFLIGALHNRENNRDFGGVLHNGQRIIGTGKKTTLVPKGRGPFTSWDEAAVDALKLQKMDKVAEWPIERILYEAEKYNGFGYFSRGVNSPYVWGGTSHQQKGKFVADGKFDPNHTDQQLGVAAILKALVQIDESVAERFSGVEDRPTAPVESLDHFTNDALVSELLSRRGIKSVLIEYGK